MNRLLVALAALALAPAAMADSEFSVVLQGGASHYTSSLASGSDTGAAYGVRLGMLPTPMLGVELGYLGTQNNVKQSLDIGREASTLKTNEGYADVRLNILPGAVTPYVFGGYGLTWVNGGAASGVPNKTANTLPFGGGIGYMGAASNGGLGAVAEAGIETFRLHGVRMLAGAQLAIPFFDTTRTAFGNPSSGRTVFPAAFVRFAF